MRDINFFSSYFKVQKTSKRITLFWGILVAFILTTTIGFYTWYYFTSNHLESEIDQLNHFINSKVTIKNMNELNTLQKKSKLLSEYYNIVKEIDNSIFSNDRINQQLLIELSIQVPKDTYFTALSIAQDRLQIQGISKTRTSVAKLEYNLKLLNNIKEVHVSNISRDIKEHDGYVFTMVCSLEGDYDEAN